MGKKYLNEIYKDEWDSLLGDQSIYQENENELLENKTFTVTIVQPSGAVIEVVVNGTDVHTSTFTAHWDDTYTVRFKNGSNPNNLILNAIQGKVARNITIQAYDANTENKHETYTVNIVQSPNQTINVLHNNVIKTKSFTAQKYDYYSATVDASEGYTAGKLNNGSGPVTRNITVSATAATINSADYRTITIVQSAHQTVIVRYNNKDYTSSFAAPIGARYEVTVKPEEGYNAGEPVDEGDGVVSDNTEIYAFPAVIKKFNIHIVQSAHQTIKVKYENENYTADFGNVPYGTQLTAVLEPDLGYSKGKINATSYRVTADFTFKCTEDATLKYFDIIIPATTNQTITVSWKLPGESSYAHSEQSGKSTKTISVPYGTEWKATVAPISADYLAGTLTPASGTVTGDTTLVITAAVLNQFALTINNPGNGSIIVEVDGVQTTYTGNATVMIQKDKTVNVYAVSNDGFRVERLDVW